MGLGDILSNVVYTFKADTAPLKQSVRDLRGEQKKLAKQQLDDLDKQNSAMEQQLVTWGRIAAGVGAAIAAWKLATVALDAYADRSRLTNAAAGKDIDRLRESTSGLVSDMDLLRLAADANTGTFKLTQNQLELVGQGIVSLSREGRDLTRVTERVGQAIREGNVEPLKELGIIIKDVEGDSVQALHAVLDALKEMGPGVEQAGEGVRRAQTKMRNGWDDLKAGIGEFVNEFSFAFTAIGDAFSFLADHMKETAAVVIFPITAPILAAAAALDYLGGPLSAIDIKPKFAKGAADIAKAGVSGDAPTAAQTADLNASLSQVLLAMGTVNKATSAAADAAQKKRDAEAARAAAAAAREQSKIDDAEAFRSLLDELAQKPVGVTGSIVFPDAVLHGGAASGTVAGAGDIFDDIGPLSRGGPRSTAQLQGVPNHMEALVQGAVAGSDAFQLFKTSSLSAMAAVVQGSMSMGQALRKVMGDVIMGKGMLVFAEGIEASVKAAVSLVNPATASLAGGYFATAGLAFAQAGVLFTLARGLGAIGNAPGGRSGQAGTSAGLGPRFGSDPGNRTSNTTIILGDSFSSRSERERNRDLSNELKRARLNSDDNASAAA